MDFANRVRLITDQTKLPFGWEIVFRAGSGLSYYLQVYDYNAIDNVTGLPISWSGRKWLLSEHMTDGEIVQTIFLATMTAMEHEVREMFLYKGQAIFDPHYDVEKLVELRSAPDALKERAPMPDLAEATACLREMVRLADMGFGQSMLEPEENGNFAAYERAKRFLSTGQWE